MSKDETERRVPSLRFKGFTDDWMQRELAEITSIIGGGTPSTKIVDYWDGDINWFTPSEIGDNIYAHNSIRKITKMGLKNSSAKILPKNKTILFTSRAGIGDTAILKNDAATNQGFQSLIVKENVDIYFLYSMAPFIKKEAIRRASGSTFLEISVTEMKKIKLYIPNVYEQKKIGKLIQILDRIITLEHRRRNALYALKKAVYQQIFGVIEKKHVLYFRSKQEEWNVVHFKEIIQSSFKGTMKVNDLTTGETEYLDTNRLNGGAPIYCDAIPDVTENDILILWDGSKAGKIYTGFEGVLGSTLKAYRLIEGVDSNYIYHYLKNKEEKITHSYTTPNIPHVVKDFDSVFKILLPSYIEQIKIGKLLNFSDTILNKCEKKISDYQSIKKILLTNMFV